MSICRLKSHLHDRPAPPVPCHAPAPPEPRTFVPRASFAEPATARSARASSPRRPAPWAGSAAHTCPTGPQKSAMARSSAAAVVSSSRRSGETRGRGANPMDERVAPRGVCSHPPACNAELQHRLTDRQCGPPTRHPRRLVRTIRSGAWCSRPPAGPPPASPGGDSASQPGRATHASHPKQHAGVLTPHSNPQYSVQRPHPGLGLELRGRRAQCEEEGCCKLAAADGTRHCVAHGGG